VKKVLLAWSSGKDSAWSLHVLRGRGVAVGGLLTTVTQLVGVPEGIPANLVPAGGPAADLGVRPTSENRVAMHGVRLSFLEAQAGAAGIPLWEVPLPWPCTNDIYEARMGEACRRAIDEGFDTIAFGDLFLQDVRAYRERQLAGSGLAPIFPLWDLPTPALARDMIAGGLRARLSCIDSRRLPESFAGREFDAALLSDLPADADPCGENGEFHTCVYAGPMFAAPIPIESGGTHRYETFIYTDLWRPASSH
jgi:diphthamide synthase (EF-2-diphthine--ammonia ligase)